MKHGSLFSGIGGFDLAAQWMGWDNVFHCEINQFCQKVLKKNFPNTILHEDIRSTDFTIYRNRIDILSGGFPCQPFSLAGKRKGTADERHLWPQMLRSIREIRPAWVVGENVYGIVSWDGGLVFEQVCIDLENEGYEVQPVILPACGQNANHRRDRVWFIAHLNVNSERPSGAGIGITEIGRNKNIQQELRGEPTKFNSGCGSILFNTSNIDGDGQQRGDSKDEVITSEGREYALNDAKQGFCDASNTERLGHGKLEIQPGETEREMRRSIAKAWSAHWSEWPVEPTICGDNDGIPNRVDRIKALGNAIVPQIAYEIFKVIRSINHPAR